jgi:hypothetical protein
VFVPIEKKMNKFRVQSKLDRISVLPSQFI